MNVQDIKDSLRAGGYSLDDLAELRGVIDEAEDVIRKAMELDAQALRQGDRVMLKNVRPSRLNGGIATIIAFKGPDAVCAWGSNGFEKGERLLVPMECLHKIRSSP